MSTQLEKLVREWRDAQKAIDRLTVQERQGNHEPLDRLIAAHHALIKYADEELTREMMTREQLHDVMASRAIIRLSPQRWVLDLRAVMFEGETLRAITDLMWAEIAKHLPIQICGLESTAVGLVAALVLKAHEAHHAANGFFIRKARKDRDLRKMIEGTPNGCPVALVDDILNTGQTMRRQIETLANAGLQVRVVAVVVRFRELLAYSDFAARGIRVASIFSLAEFGVKP